MKKPVKILLIVLSTFLFIAAASVLVFRMYPELAAKLILHGTNSFEPLFTPNRTMRQDGVLYVNDICYGDTYPNSFLDIYYPTEDITAKRPTIFYIHGGGYFAGSKLSGDPLAMGDGGDAFFNEIILNGYNLVKIDYALITEYIMPTQLLQIDQALDYLQKNQDELGLDMSRLVIMGGSAGAAFTSQYGLILTNPDYAEQIGITPSISAEQVKALVIDDAPIDLDRASWVLKLMACGETGTSNPKHANYNLYQSAKHVTSAYIPSFLCSANGDEFVDDMDELYSNLLAVGVETFYYTKSKEEAGELGHCFMEVNYADNRFAQEAAEQMLSFIEKQIDD